MGNCSRHWLLGERAQMGCSPLDKVYLLQLQTQNYFETANLQQETERYKHCKQRQQAPHCAAFLTEMSYLASELSKTVQIQKNTTGNGISAKFKISNCELQQLADVKFLFIYLFYGMFTGFILIFFCMLVFQIFS